jgi:tRNA(Ile)-lysidine synthase
MKPRHNMIIRPLLFATRNAIVNYCTINNIDYREDRSNSDIKYLRNRLRHEIIPLFREINPSFDEAVSDTARILSETDQIKTDRINELKASLSVENGDHVHFSAAELRGLSQSPTVIFELFRPYGIGRGQVDDLIRILSGKTGSRIITASHRIIRNRNEIIVIPLAGDNGIRIEAASLTEMEAMKDILSIEILDITSGFEIPRLQTIACLDLKKIKFPLVLRRWKPGDSFYPLGMSGRKKLSDYFTDRKFSPERKEKCLILESSGKIAWIAGERIDNRFRITGKTKTAIVLTLRNID